jgi:hypothetical protein
MSVSLVRHVARFAFLVSVTTSLAIAATDDDARKAADAFQALFGADVARVKGTPLPADDVELAVRLVETARRSADQPALVAVMCDRAYDLGGAHPTGYAAAIEAMELLAAAVPDRKAECAARRLDIRQRHFDSASGQEKAGAGEALLDELLALADQREESHETAEVVSILRRAQGVAKVVSSPRASEIDARVSVLTETMKILRQIEDVKGLLARNPGNTAAREGLVRLYLVNLDRPDQAALHLEGVKDEALLKYVPAAAKGIDAAPELACLELGEWYRGLAETAPPANRAAMYARATEYLERFLERHDAKDLDNTRATIALEKVTAAIAALSAQGGAPTGSGRRGQWIDLLALVDPARDAIVGKWERRGNDLAATGGGADLAIPVLVAGDYDLELRLTPIDGSGYLGMSLPVGATGVNVYFSRVSSKCGLSRVSGKGHDANETTNRNAIVENGRSYVVYAKIAAQEKSAQIQVSCDGAQVILWQGPLSALTLNHRTGMPSQPGLEAWNCNVIFHSIRLRMLSGQAKPLRQAGKAAGQDAIVGTWQKKDTGTLFQFTADGSFRAPAAVDKKYTSGRWRLDGAQVHLVFRDETVVLTVTDANTLSGWGVTSLVRQPPLPAR